jgi:hypothetical protein
MSLSGRHRLRPGIETEQGEGGPGHCDRFGLPRRHLRQPPLPHETVPQQCEDNSATSAVEGTDLPAKRLSEPQENLRLRLRTVGLRERVLRLQGERHDAGYKLGPGAIRAAAGRYRLA